MRFGGYLKALKSHIFITPPAVVSLRQAANTEGSHGVACYYSDRVRVGIDEFPA
ncbi:hypothetical protein HMPREF3034_02008 [Prevotella sp. DNF00663]|nr:hypothetical protein HMPREF3034_02008 [Prevotella sp. DNF00663]